MLTGYTYILFRQVYFIYGTHICCCRPTDIATASIRFVTMHFRYISLHQAFRWWLGSRMVSLLDSSAEGPGFKSQPRRCWITVLGKLFTPIVLCSPSSEIGSSPLKGCGGNRRPGGK